MQKNNLHIYALLALVVLFVSINFQNILDFNNNFNKSSARTRLSASVIGSQLNNASCQTPGRKYNLISIGHHVNAPEYFTDFADCPTKVATNSGDWFNTSTWSGSIPGENDIVLIPKGLSVSLKDNAKVKTIGVAGSFTLNPTSDSDLHVSNFLTYPGSNLDITPDRNAIQDIVFTGSLDSSKDPGQFGVGLVAIDSNINIVGRSTQNTNSKISAGGAISGSSNIQVEDSISDWRVGQSVIFSDAKKVDSNAEYVSYTEIKKITSISGRSFTIDSPLVNSYKSSVVYVGQNIRFSSKASVKGHILFTGNTKLEFSGVYIEKLGRTRSSPTGSATISANGEVQSIASNQIGRYSLHAHHLEQPYHIEGNVIYNIGLDDKNDDMQRWNATLHMSYGIFENNSVVNPGEAGIAVETFLDTGLVKNNLVIGSGGGGRYASLVQSFGIWSRSPFINIVDNRVEGYVKAFAYWIDSDDFGIYDGMTFPRISGSSLSGKNVQSQTGPGKFSGNRNTAYIGFNSREYLSASGSLWVAHMFGSTYNVEDFVSTHGGVTSFYTRDVYFNNIKINETEKTSNSSEFGFVSVGSVAKITNSEIKGFTYGYNPTSFGVFKNGVLDNEVDVVTFIGDFISSGHHLSSGSGPVLDSVKFSPNGIHIVAAAFSPISSANFTNNSLLNYIRTGTPETFRSDLTTYLQRGPESFVRLLSPDRRIVVKNYNNNGSDFLVYPSYQAADFKIPVIDSTNQELFDGKSSHPYAAGVVGRSIGDHIVKNPISNPKILGLVEAVSPFTVIQDYNYFFPNAVRDGYTLKYYTNSSGVEYDSNNKLPNYGGQEKVIQNVKLSRGLNKILTEIKGQKYTLLVVGPDGLPTSTSDIVKIETPVDTTIPQIPPIDPNKIPDNSQTTIPPVAPINNTSITVLNPRGGEYVVGNTEASATANPLQISWTSTGLNNKFFRVALKNKGGDVCNLGYVSSNTQYVNVFPYIGYKCLNSDMIITPGEYKALVHVDATTDLSMRDESDVFFTLSSNVLGSTDKSQGLKVSIGTPLNAVACPFETNITRKSGVSSYQVYANTAKQFATGGTAPYSISPLYLSLYISDRVTIPVKITDSTNKSVTVNCNFVLTDAVQYTQTSTPTPTPVQTYAPVQTTAATSPTSQASGVPVSITSYENKTTFTTGNVIFDAVGPTDGVYYRWNITNSSGVTTTQQNGYVITKMYWNFTTPGTYKVNLSVLDNNTGAVVGTSNTITVTITSGQNGASTITIFDWFIGLFR
jgi:hypothetical protein